MARKDLLMLKQKELKRLHVVNKALQGEITQKQAAELSGLSERQIRRIVKRIRSEATRGSCTVAEGDSPTGNCLRSSQID